MIGIPKVTKLLATKVVLVFKNSKFLTKYKLELARLTF